MNNPKVSVVIPLYNEEKYLNTCIESIVNQTYKNLEIILVDDGSFDNSPKICDNWALNDSRVKVIHKENGGLSSTRNKGIEASSGQYVTIVDGDDWLDLTTIEKCVNNALLNDSDCVMFSYLRQYPNGSSSRVKLLVAQQSSTNLSNLVFRRLFGPVDEELKNPLTLNIFASCCMKLYKRDIALKGKYFDVSLVGSCEDGLFNMYALHDAKTITYIDEPLYNYRKNVSSLTNSYRPLLQEQWCTLFNIMENIIDEFNLDEKCKKALNNRIALSMIGIGINELLNPIKKERKKAIKKHLKSQRFSSVCKHFKLKYLPLKWKLFMFCCKHKMTNSVYLLLIFMKRLKERG